MKKIIYFTASWCNPCKVMGPMLEQISSNIPVDKIDVDSNRDLVSQYHIKSLPTLILLQNGVEIKRSIGSKSLSELTQFVS